MAAPRMTEPNYPDPNDPIKADYRDRVPPAPPNNVTWGVLAAIVVAIGIGAYMYSNYSYGPKVASDRAGPTIGMNSPAPMTPAVPVVPSPPVRQVQ
jgi:hypothetical protein